MRGWLCLCCVKVKGVAHTSGACRYDLSLFSAGGACYAQQGWVVRSCLFTIARSSCHHLGPETLCCLRGDNNDPGPRFSDWCKVGVSVVADVSERCTGRPEYKGKAQAGPKPIWKVRSLQLSTSPPAPPRLTSIRRSGSGSIKTGNGVLDAGCLRSG